MLVASVNVSAQSTFNKQLSALLDTVYKEDQADRLKIDRLRKQYGWQSPQMQSLFQKMHIQDSINLTKVKKIIDTYGWLGADEVGRQGAKTIFLVIQHADSLTQVTYLPLMRQAVTNRKANPQDSALLEDRVLTKQGKEQIYGSQVRTNEKGKYEFYPIEDEVNVNKRRASVGLEPIEKYAKHFDIKYASPKLKQAN
jgi:hypothetical protein